MLIEQSLIEDMREQILMRFCISRDNSAKKITILTFKLCVM